MVERSVRFGAKLVRLLTLAAISVLFPGCALYRDGAEEVSSYLRSDAKARSQLGGVYARAPEAPPDEAAPEPARAQTRTLETLRDYIVLAMERNPDINAAEEMARSKVERVRQVTALPDPFVNAKALPEPVRTAEGDNFFTLGISQKLPVPEKLDRAGRIAIEETRMALQ